MTVLPLYLPLRSNFLHRQLHITQTFKLKLKGKKTGNVRHHSFHEFHELTKKGWCNESAATFNLKSNKNFLWRTTKKLKDFALKWQVKHTSFVMESFIPFHSLVTLVGTESVTNEQTGTLNQTLETINLTSKLESETFSSETYDPNSEIMSTQSIDPKNRSKCQFRKYCKNCPKSIHSIQKQFRKQREDEQRKRNS